MVGNTLVGCVAMGRRTDDIPHNKQIGVGVPVYCALSGSYFFMAWQCLRIQVNRARQDVAMLCGNVGVIVGPR